MVVWCWWAGRAERIVPRDAPRLSVSSQRDAPYAGLAVRASYTRLLSCSHRRPGTADRSTRAQPGEHAPGLGERFGDERERGLAEA